mgnify:CR=1 FL=1
MAGKIFAGVSGRVLVISHDRAFLDHVAEEILEMEGGTLHRYKGNYSAYLEQKSIQVLSQTRATKPSRNISPKRKNTSAAIRRASKARWPGAASPS